MPKQTFTPPSLPAQISYEPLVTEIARAHASLARLNELLRQLHNPKLLGRSFTTKEAVLSSKIEGTQATISDVLEFEAGAKAGKEWQSRRDEFVEIVNYRRALDIGMRTIETGEPISEGMIKRLHIALLSVGRGYQRAPGEFRRSQVFIGPPGASIEQASYIPPLPDEIPPLMSNLLQYLNSQEMERDSLVQAGVMHYQFEAIHPFLDGNGRIGRLLISLFLYQRKLLLHPFLYLSEYFEQHRQEYYDLLLAVSETGDWISWLRFFLAGLDTQSQKACESAHQILQLHRQLSERMRTFNSRYAHDLLDAIFVMPIFTVKDINRTAQVRNIQTLYNLIQKFTDAGIISGQMARRRNRIYVFKELVDLLRI